MRLTNTVALLTEWTTVKAPNNVVLAFVNQTFMGLVQPARSRWTMNIVTRHGIQTSATPIGVVKIPRCAILTLVPPQAPLIRVCTSHNLVKRRYNRFAMAVVITNVSNRLQTPAFLINTCKRCSAQALQQLFAPALPVNAKVDYAVVQGPSMSRENVLPPQVGPLRRAR